MKKLMMIIVPMLLSGCAMGINQSTVTMEGKQYLVEKATYAAPLFLPIQWSSEPTYTELEPNNVRKAKATDYLRMLRHKCEMRDVSSDGGPSDEQVYHCIVNELSKTSI